MVGPPLTGFSTSSVEAIRKLTMGDIPVVPQIHLPSVDVRDCAEAHMKALLAEDRSLHGQRILIN
jgi:hypothetical protein